MRRLHHARLTGRRIGAQIAADIPCGQIDGAKASDLNVCKVLADAALFSKDLFDWSSDRGHF